MQASNIPPRWTAMLYLAGANDLSNSMQRSLDELRQSELPANLDVFVQSYNAEGASVRFRLSRDEKGRTVESERAVAPSNSGDAASLSDFVSYAKQFNPDASTFLIAGGHGEGHRGVAIDDPHHDRLSLSELEGALSPNPVDALLFDSCLMGSLEVAHALAGEAGVVVASADVVRSGTALGPLLQAAAQSSDAAALGSRLVRERATGFSTLTAVSTDHLEGVVEPMTALSQELLKLDTARIRELHQASRRALMSAGNVLMGYYTYPGDRVDVGDFCRLIADASDLPQGLKTAARALRESLASATLAHSNKGADNSTGLTLALPLYRTEAKAAPEEVALWQATGWDRVIERFQVQDAEKCRPPAFPLFFQN